MSSSGAASGGVPLTGAVAAAGTVAIGTKVVGDANDRFEVLGDGSIKLGPGNAALDATLKRNAAGDIEADCAFNRFVILVDHNGATKLQVGAAGIGYHGHAVAGQAGAIAAPTAPGAVYSQAEAQSAVAAINALRAALSGNGFTA